MNNILPPGLLTINPLVPPPPRIPRTQAKMNPISKKRITKDINKLKLAEPNMHVLSELKELEFTLTGPKDTCYEGAKFTIYVYLPINYPFKSPSIAFRTKIYHPNIDAQSGAVCLDVINQKWSPSFSLVNIFDKFLPYLLTYPNPDDPLNRDAADNYKTNKRVYAAKVKEYIVKYCQDE